MKFFEIYDIFFMLQRIEKSAFLEDINVYSSFRQRFFIALSYYVTLLQQKKSEIIFQMR